MKTEFSFKPLVLNCKRKQCLAPVAASVRKTAKDWVTIRFRSEVLKKLGWKKGDVITPFADEQNRALLLLNDQRPVPESARKLYGKATTLEVAFPRDGVFSKWFLVGPMRELPVAEVSHGRLVVTIPNTPQK